MILSVIIKINLVNFNQLRFNFIKRLMNFFLNIFETNETKTKPNVFIICICLCNRQPSLVVDKRNISQVPSSIESTIGSIAASHIPIYQPLSHSIKQTNTTTTKNNGFNADQIQLSHSNPFQTNLIDNELITNLDGQHKSNETTIESTSPPTAISSPSKFIQQFSPSLSRTSSMSERDHITETQLSKLPNIGRAPLQSSYRNVENFSSLAKLNPVLTSSTPPPPPLSSTITDEFTPQIGKLNYDYSQSEIPIATLEHQRIDHLKHPTSPQMLHFQEIEDRMVCELNELYKATMLIHSNPRDPPQRLEQNDIQQMNQPLMQHEPTYNFG